MDLKDIPEPSVHRRKLGRSRNYTYVDLPERLQRWHAPRANRWEYLCVVTGPLDIEWLNAGTVTPERLHAGDKRWIAPGTRWRVIQMQIHTRFQLEIHADDSTPVSAPQVVRAALLDDADCLQLDDEAAFTRLLADLAPGERRLARGDFDFTTPMRAAIANSEQTLCWHPLDTGKEHCTALISRSAQAVGLLEYLGRDHAVIEAALAGALRGDVEHELWLRNALARHLVIEEDMLFPAYLNSGGNSGWVRGLCNEHKYLRHHLDRLSDALSQRKFLLLLDGHDEKEEQIVYPDILRRLGNDADGLNAQVQALGAASFARSKKPENDSEVIMPDTQPSENDS